MTVQYGSFLRRTCGPVAVSFLQLPQPLRIADLEPRRTSPSSDRTSADSSNACGTAPPCRVPLRTPSKHLQSAPLCNGSSSGPGSSRSGAAALSRPRRMPWIRILSARNALPLCCAGHSYRLRPWQDRRSAHQSGLRCLPEGSRCSASVSSADPHHPRQSVSSQNRTGAGVPGVESTRASPLHSHLLLLAQSGRTVVHCRHFEDIGGDLPCTERTHVNGTTRPGSRRGLAPSKARNSAFCRTCKALTV